MTQFASRTPYDIVRTDEDEALIANGDFRAEEVYGLVPSRFYNRANPVLTYFRGFLEGRTGEDFRQEVFSLDDALDDVVGYTPEQVDHGHRVLARLGAL